MKERLEYKTPRASVRGVFLCENLAAPAAVSCLTGQITQEGWGSDTIAGDTDSNGDIWLVL
jgi:hypothetical protein